MSNSNNWNVNHPYTFTLCFALLAAGLAVSPLEQSEVLEHGSGLNVEGAKFVCTNYAKDGDGGRYVLITCLSTRGFQIVSADNMPSGVAAVRRMVTDFKNQTQRPKEMPPPNDNNQGEGMPRSVRQLLDMLGFKDFQLLDFKGVEPNSVLIENVRVNVDQITEDEVPSEFLRAVANQFIGKVGASRPVVIAYNKLSGLMTIDCSESKFGVRVPEHGKYAEIYHYNTQIERRVMLDPMLVYSQFALMGGAVLHAKTTGNDTGLKELSNLLDRRYPQPEPFVEQTAPVKEEISPEDGFNFQTTGEEGDFGSETIRSHGFDIVVDFEKGPLGYNIEIAAFKGAVQITGNGHFVRSPIDCDCVDGSCCSHYANEMLPDLIRTAKATYARMTN